MHGEYGGSAHRLEPKDEERFYPTQVKSIIKEVLEEKLQGQTFDDSNAQTLALDISNVVKAKCKELRIPRYKLIVQTVVGENQNQGVRLASKSLWNAKIDNYASASHMNDHLFAVCMVFGAYFE